MIQKKSAFAEFERVFALRVRGFAPRFPGAALDMHFSLSPDLTPLHRFLDTAGRTEGERTGPQGQHRACAPVSRPYGRRLVASCQTATLLAPNAIASTMMTIISMVDGPGEFEEAARREASSARLIWVEDWGMVVGSGMMVVEEGGTVTAVDGG